MSVYTSNVVPNYLLLPTALYVTATPSYDVSQTSPTANVTVTLSKDLATLENITISVLLQDPQGQGKSMIYFGPIKGVSNFKPVFVDCP